MAGHPRGTDSPQGPGVRIPKEGGRSRSPLDQAGLPWRLSGSPSAFTIPFSGAQGPCAQDQGANTGLAGPTVTVRLRSQPCPLGPRMEAGVWRRPAEGGRRAAFSSQAMKLWVLMAGSAGPGGLRDARAGSPAHGTSRSRCWLPMRSVGVGTARGQPGLRARPAGSAEARVLLVAGSSGARGTSPGRTPGTASTSLTFHSPGAPSAGSEN